MNYFQTLPKELNYIIFTYSDYSSLYELSKELELYVNYGELLRVRYPKNYTHLIKYIKINTLEYYYSNLESFEFEDNLVEYKHRIRHISESDLNEHLVFELVSRIYLETQYDGILSQIFDQFPQDEYKYTVLLESMSELEEYDNELTKLILKTGDISQIDLKYLNKVIGDIGNSEIYILILAIKYYLTKQDLSHFIYEDPIKYYRDVVIDNPSFNYISKVIKAIDIYFDHF